MTLTRAEAARVVVQDRQRRRRALAEGLGTQNRPKTDFCVRHGGGLKCTVRRGKVCVLVFFVELLGALV